MALVAQIALINAFNRGNVILQQPAGDYRPVSWWGVGWRMITLVVV